MKNFITQIMELQKKYELKVRITFDANSFFSINPVSKIWIGHYNEYPNEELIKKNLQQSIDWVKNNNYIIKDIEPIEISEIYTVTDY